MVSSGTFRENYTSDGISNLPYSDSSPTSPRTWIIEVRTWTESTVPSLVPEVFSRFRKRLFYRWRRRDSETLRNSSVPLTSVPSSSQNRNHCGRCFGVGPFSFPRCSVEEMRVSLTSYLSEILHLEHCWPGWFSGWLGKSDRSTGRVRGVTGENWKGKENLPETSIIVGECGGKSRL